MQLRPATLSVARRTQQERKMSAVAAPGSSSFTVDAHGVHDRVDRELLDEHLAGDEFFWLDLHRPTAEELSLLTDVFKFHPLAVEDADHFDQRPKIDTYDDYILVVAYGCNEDQDGLVEVHCFYSERFLVTVHRDNCPTFDDLRRRAARDMALPAQGAMMLYLVLDALADSFFPGLSKIDDRIDELEDEMFKKPDDAQLQELFRLKRRLVGWRKVISPERDLLARIVTGVVAIPGMTSDVERYYRDLYDHLIRINDLVDSYRDLLTGAMEVYLSTVSNRLNDVMRQLTMMSTVFIPLTWIVGFFGMNFGWMIRHITGWGPFVLLAVMTQVVALAITFVLFRRRGWI
jgi:magnesium transporter